MGELNLKSTTIEKSIDLAKDFLQKLIGPPLDELGLLFSDNVKLWRLKNQIRNLEKVKKIVEEQKIDIKQINLKILVPYMEGVSLEEDDKLQDLWANLFVNYIDSNKNLILHVYPNILKQLSSNEVLILTFMDDKGVIDTSKKITEKYMLPSKEEIANLERLGLIKEKIEFSQYGGEHDDHNGEYKWELEEVGSWEYYITSFGKEFINACKR